MIHRTTTTTTSFIYRFFYVESRIVGEQRTAGLASASKRLIKVLNRKPVDRAPIWLMRQAGRYLPEYREIRAGAGTFLDLCYNPELAAEVTLQPIRRYPLDASIVFSDILVIPDALGQKVAFKEGVGPVLEAIATAEDIAGLTTARQADHLAPVYETLGRVKKGLPDDVALIGFAGAPWTIATYMIEGGGSRDYAATKGWAFRAPESFQTLISLLEESISAHLIAQVNAGAEVLQIFDSWAGMLPEGAFERWSLEPISRIVGQVKATAPDVPIIVFPRLAGVRYAAFAGIDGIAAVSLDQTMPRKWAAKNLQPQLAVQGNLDPVYLVEGGEALRSEAGKILDVFGNGPFIFNLGHGVLQTTPPEHVAVLCEFVTQWAGSTVKY
jgi:uroporphyrinogen decarboxylase